MKKDNKEIERFLIDSIKNIELTSFGPIMTVIGCLVWLKSKKATDILLDILEKQMNTDLMPDDPCCIIIRIANAFSEIKDERAVMPLIDVLRRLQEYKKNKSQKCEGNTIPSIFECLGNIGNIRAIDPLIGLAQDGLGDLEHISQALRAINNRKALEGLYTMRNQAQKYTNKDAVEEITETIRIIEETAPLLCYRCGKEPTIKDIGLITKPHHRSICKSCWRDLEPLQNNPDTRTVSFCGWEPDKSPPIRKRKTS